MSKSEEPEQSPSEEIWDEGTRGEAVQDEIPTHLTQILSGRAHVGAYDQHSERHKAGCGMPRATCLHFGCAGRWTRPLRLSRARRLCSPIKLTKREQTTTQT